MSIEPNACSTPNSAKRNRSQISPLYSDIIKRPKPNTPDTDSSNSNHGNSESNSSYSSATTMSSEETDGNIEQPGQDASIGQWGLYLSTLMKQSDTKINNLSDKLTSEINNQVKLSEAVGILTKSMEKLVMENSTLKYENTELKERMIKLEYHTMRNNILFDGIPEIRGERSSDCYTKVIEHLSKLFEDGDTTAKEQAEQIVINRIHRFGEFIPGRTRSIIANLQWYGDKEYIMRERKKLPEGIYVNDHYPAEIQERRRLLRPILKMGLRQDHYKGKISIRYDKLVVMGKQYSMSNLHDLPADLNPAKICEREQNGEIGFFGIHSGFSNFHPSTFKQNGITYNSVEQNIQSKKAALFNDDATEYRIMRCNNPLEIKRLGGKVTNYVRQQWEQNCYDIAYQAVLCKFRQNPPLRAKLLSTDKTIFEGSRDPLWGCGVAFNNSNLFVKERWSNDGGIMRRVYDAVREELKRDNATAVPTSSSEPT